METIHLNSGYEDYWWLPSHVRRHGVRCTPRGTSTYDVGPTTLVVKSPRFALPLGCGRNVAPRIGAVETLQLIGAFADAELTTWASENFTRYAEPNGSFWGAYGERMGSQLMHVWHKLREDPDTRQAVITLWQPTLDNQRGKRDYPCTVALTFRLINRKRLELTTVMRSNDVWLGTPYDLFQFTQLQLTMATLLGVEAGVYRHVALSLHIYDEHVPLIDQLHEPTGKTFQPNGLARPGDSIETVEQRAFRLVYTAQDRLLEPLNSSGIWYRDRVSGFIRFIEQKRKVERDKPYGKTDLG